MAQQIAFFIVVVSSFALAYHLYSRVISNIRLGKDEDISGNEGQRWKNVMLVAFGQKKMFKRWMPAVFHFFIYAAFLVTQVELIEIFVDGFSGQHRMFAAPLGGFYTFVLNTIEILSLLAFVATVIFLARRNLLKLPRFWNYEMTFWPRLDANLILIGEILLIIGIFAMNGADVVLQNIDPAHYPETGTLLISDTFGPILLGWMSTDWLMYTERFGWWLHFLVVLGFLNYLPVSKHLHIFFSFPNVWYARLNPRGEMQNIPEITTEIKSMLGLETNEPEAEMTDEIPDFGAKDIQDLSWKTLLDAYSCTECGRCTAVCPAHITGKKLSPRKIMMDIRDRMEEVRGKLDSAFQKYNADGKGPLTPENFDDGRSLFDYISEEEIYACTTCQACVEACPVMINPLDPILQLRRYQILTESKGPSDWLPMFNSLESTGAVWQMGMERDQWAKGDV